MCLNAAALLTRSRGVKTLKNRVVSCVLSYAARLSAPTWGRPTEREYSRAMGNDLEPLMKRVK